MCKVISCASQKGGVTKTTTVLNLATALALMGKKVLAVDTDPQGSLTTCAGVQDPDHLTHSTYTLMSAVMDEEELPAPSEYIIHCEKIDVIPCNITLSAFELNRGHEIGCERALQAVIEPLRELYDVIILDCGPSLGILTVNAITASDGVLIAVCEYENAELSLKYLFDVTQTNGREIPPIWKLDDRLSSGVLNRLTHSHDIKADNITDCIGKIVDNAVAGKADIFLKGLENDIRGHFLGELPKDGLTAEVEELIAQSCKYFIASRCGIETDGIEMPTILYLSALS